VCSPCAVRVMCLPKNKMRLIEGGAHKSAGYSAASLTAPATA
jgi:hypothetical protein